MMCSGLAFVHRQARILVLAHAPQHLIQAGVHRNRHDGVARHHDFARVIVGKLEQRLNGVFFEAMQMPFAAAGADDELQLFGRVSSAAMAAAQADPARDGSGGCLRRKR